MEAVRWISVARKAVVNLVAEEAAEEAVGEVVMVVINSQKL